MNTGQLLTTMNFIYLKLKVLVLIPMHAHAHTHTHEYTNYIVNEIHESTGVFAE